MNCKDFWRTFEDSGLTPELETHLGDCPGCRKEMEAEKALMSAAQNLPQHKAPDYLWDRISRELPEEQPAHSRLNAIAETVVNGIRGLFSPVRVLQLKPVLVGLAIMITSVLATHYYHTGPFTGDKVWFRKEAVLSLEEVEQEYLAAIDRLTEQVELNKDSIEPELYDLYSEKLAVLDEYILQCRDALEENEYNPNARQYLAMAYMEKMETLKEITEQYL